MTDDRPLVDVGVVTWNTSDVTVSCLRALLDSDQGCRVRLLVRDNRSHDGTVDALRRHVPEAELDAGDVNLGFAGGVNTLLARSQAPWFFLLNSDASPHPGAIGALVRTMEAHPEAAVVAPRLERGDGALEHSTFPFPSTRVAALCAFAWERMPAARKQELFLEGAWLHDRPRDVDWAVGAAMLLRRSALDDIGGFDERYFMYVEDLEWCWRARKKGWTIRFEPSAVVRHVGNVSGEQMFGGFRTREHVRNSYRFYAREHGFLGAAAWWFVNVTGTAYRLCRALATDRRRARRWLEHLDAHMAAIIPRRPTGTLP